MGKRFGKHFSEVDIKIQEKFISIIIKEMAVKFMMRY